jgi:ubiquinone/menaquinone biosynthesis C-methylase UbiE
MNKQDLSEGSKSYHDEAHIYECFSQAEDKPGKILELLQPLTVNKEVLDIGCGTGKYLIKLAPHAKRYVGLDISEDQLRIAKTKLDGLKNVDLICSSAESINLPSESIDIIISTWVFGTILDENRRIKALSEAQRVLRKNSGIYLVENDLDGDFESIRGRYPDSSKTQAYNSWLEQKGFTPHIRFSTYFEFKDLEEAKSIFGSIWGQDAANKVSDKTITQNIVVYEKRKDTV